MDSFAKLHLFLLWFHAHCFTPPSPHVTFSGVVAFYSSKDVPAKVGLDLEMWLFITTNLLLFVVLIDSSSYP